MPSANVQVKSYKDLIAWKCAISLVTEIYTATLAFPREETYGLTRQMRRASISIASNIAEGHGRATRGEFAQFLCHARGSLYELETQLVIAQKLCYVRSDNERHLVAAIDELGRILNGLVSSIQRRKLGVTAPLVADP
jgi:four helix bundle protein